MVGTFVTTLNQTVLITALPHIMRSFSISADTAQWLTTAYLMMNGILIPVTAFLSEKYTTRQLFIAGMGLFIAGTALATVSNSFPMLLIARVIQACGPGINLPLMQTVFFKVFPKDKRGAAMGLAGLVVGFAPAIGPTLSGLIVDHFSWRYIFLIVLPVAIVVFALGIVYMRNVTEVSKGRRIDLPSVVLSTLGFGLLLYGTSVAGSSNNSGAAIWLVAGAIGIALFVIRELKIDKPMLEFRVFKYYLFTLTTLIAVISLTSSIGVELILPLYLQNLRNISGFHSGLILLPGAIVTGIASPIGGRIVDKIGGKQLSIVGFIIITAATIPFIFLRIDTPIWLLILFYSIRLLGISAIMMPVTTVGLNALPGNLISHGTAMNNTFRQVGSSIGTALLVTVYTGVSNTAMQSRRIPDPVHAQVHGMNYAFLVVAAFAFAGIVISFFLKSGRKKEDGEPVLESTD